MLPHFMVYKSMYNLEPKNIEDLWLSDTDEWFLNEFKEYLEKQLSLGKETITYPMNRYLEESRILMRLGFLQYPVKLLEKYVDLSEWFPERVSEHTWERVLELDLRRTSQEGKKEDL